MAVFVAIINAHVNVGRVADVDVLSLPRVGLWLWNSGKMRGVGAELFDVNAPRFETSGLGEPRTIGTFPRSRLLP